MSSKEPTSMFDPSAQTRSSRPASVFSAQSIDTVVADQSYRGFPSEEAYLDALKTWVQSKMFYEAEDQLTGFYGKNTVDDILSKQGTVRGAKKSTSTRRATVVPQLATVAEHNTDAVALSRRSSANAAASAANASKDSRGSILKRVFTRRKTVV